MRNLTFLQKHYSLGGWYVIWGLGFLLNFEDRSNSIRGTIETDIRITQQHIS